MAAVAAEGEAPVLQESLASKILRWVGKTPVHIFLALVGLLWLVPTIGLLVTSLLPASHFDQAGWWKVFSKPSLATWSNYSEIFKNHEITHALLTTTYIAVGGTILPILVAAMAGYALAWLEFPGRDWAFIRRSDLRATGSTDRADSSSPRGDHRSCSRHQSFAIIFI